MPERVFSALALMFLTGPVYGGSIGFFAATGASVTGGFGYPEPSTSPGTYSIATGSITPAVPIGLEPVHGTAWASVTSEYAKLSVRNGGGLTGADNYHQELSLQATATTGFDDEVTVYAPAGYDGPQSQSLYLRPLSSYVGYGGAATFSVASNAGSYYEGIPIAFGTPFELFAFITLTTREHQEQDGDSTGDVNGSAAFQFRDFTVAPADCTHAPSGCPSYVVRNVTYSTKSGVPIFAGLSNVSGSQATFVGETVPEPTTTWLVSTGFLALLTLGKRVTQRNGKVRREPEPRCVRLGQ